MPIVISDSLFTPTTDPTIGQPRAAQLRPRLTRTGPFEAAMRHLITKPSEMLVDLRIRHTQVELHATELDFTREACPHIGIGDDSIRSLGERSRDGGVFVGIVHGSSER